MEVVSNSFPVIAKKILFAGFFPHNTSTGTKHKTLKKQEQAIKSKIGIRKIYSYLNSKDLQIIHGAHFYMNGFLRAASNLNVTSILQNYFSFFLLLLHWGFDHMPISLTS